MADQQVGRDRPITPWAPAGRGGVRVVTPLSSISPNSRSGRGARARIAQGRAGGRVMTSAGIFVGIDVAKAQLDIAIRPSGEYFTAPHDDPGVSGVVQRLCALQPTLVVLEATGGFELDVASALGAAGGGQSPAGPRLRPLDWLVGEDGPAGCAGVGPLWGGAAPGRAFPPGCAGPGAQRRLAAAAPTGGDAGGREESAPHGHAADSPAAPAPHRVAAAASRGSRSGPRGAHSLEPAVAGQG